MRGGRVPAAHLGAEWQLLLSLLIKFPSSLAGCGQDARYFSHPHTRLSVVLQRCPGLTVWPVGLTLHWTPLFGCGAE